MLELWADGDADVVGMMSVGGVGRVAMANDGPTLMSRTDCSCDGCYNCSLPGLWLTSVVRCEADIWGCRQANNRDNGPESSSQVAFSVEALPFEYASMFFSLSSSLLVAMWAAPAI